MRLIILSEKGFEPVKELLFARGSASFEKSERNGGGGGFDVIFQSKGIPN